MINEALAPQDVYVIKNKGGNYLGLDGALDPTWFSWIGNADLFLTEKAAIEAKEETKCGEVKIIKIRLNFEEIE